MAITSGQLQLFLTGGAGNSDPMLSLGGVTSATQFVNATLNNLFADVTAPEGLAGSVKFRALAFKNSSAEIAYASIVYVSLDTTSTYTEVDIAFDGTGTQSIPDEDTVPSSPVLSFSHPTSIATALSLGDIPAGGEARVWFRRTVTAGAPSLSLDSGSVYFGVSTV